MYQEIKDKIVKLLGGLEYDKILLFGSRARGENRIDSDYDIIVTLKKDLERKKLFEIENIIREAFAQDYIDIDIIIKTSEEYEYLKDKIGSVVNYANVDGIVI